MRKPRTQRESNVFFLLLQSFKLDLFLLVPAMSEPRRKEVTYGGRRRGRGRSKREEKKKKRAILQQRIFFLPISDIPLQYFRSSSFVSLMCNACYEEQKKGTVVKSLSVLFSKSLFCCSPLHPQQ
jgi:hypothetical protein